LAAIKAWPIWMKVIVWWCSLIMLVCLLSLSVLRLVLYSVFWLIGFRGIWLLPNMFNDDLDFLDAFYPLFGKAVSQKELAKQAKQKRLAAKAAELEAAKQAKLAKKGVLKGTTATTTATTTTTTTSAAAPTGDKAKTEGDKAKEEPKKDGKETPAEPKKPGRCDGYNFGLINLCGILICGLIFCNYTGMFMPEMIPDFVVSKQELFAQFPSLAPPDYNATAEEEASKKSDEPIIPNLDSLLEESEELRTDDTPRTLSEELEEEVIDDVVQEE
jgi:DNA segregation ATPase FtsK/SpoIIIE-like protein